MRDENSLKVFFCFFVLFQVCTLFGSKINNKNIGLRHAVKIYIENKDSFWSILDAFIFKYVFSRDKKKQ